MRVSLAVACAASVALLAVWAVPASSAAAAECPVGQNGKPCAGNGECVEGKCQCSGRYIAPDCEKQGCPKGCSGNGKCNTESGECACDAGFTGADCADKVPECPKSADGTECGGHGECDVTTGKCVCSERWSGASCTNPECDPLCVEGSHGSCDKGTCVCDSGFRGDVCQSKTCPGLVRRPRKPSDSPNPRDEVGVSLDDDARRRAKMPAVLAQQEPVSESDARFRASSATPIGGGAHDISLAAAAEREALTAQGALAFGESGSSLLQTGESESDETAAAIMAAAGAIDQDPLSGSSSPLASAPSASAPEPAQEQQQQQDEELNGAPPAGIAEGLSVWRFRERRAALHTSSGAEVPPADADAAIKAALGLAGDDSVLARDAAEQDARFAGHSMLRRPSGDDEAASAAFEEEAREAEDMVVEYCNGHGLCRGDGTCECDQGYAGDACETRTCPSDCSGNGACDSATGKCSCQPGFYGDSCAQKRCPGLVELEDPDLPQVECTGHGDCDSATGTCSCHAPWLGADCAEKACPGMVRLTDAERALDAKNRSRVPCSQHGECTQSPDPGTCKCADGWTGIACATSACGDTHCNAKLGRGVCHTVVDEETDADAEEEEEGEAPAKGVCHCAPGYTGEHCELALCPGAGGGCSGHGRCDSQTGVCACDGAWGGPACRRPAVVHGIVVGKRYPLSLYSQLRKHERNRADVVAKLARESASEAAHEASKRRHQEAKRIAHKAAEHAEAEASEEQQDDKTKTVGDILATASDGEEDTEAALLQRVAVGSARTRSLKKGGAVLSASEDEAKAAEADEADKADEEDKTEEGKAAEADEEGKAAEADEEGKAAEADEEGKAEADNAGAAAENVEAEAENASEKADKALEHESDSPSAADLKREVKLAAVHAALEKSEDGPKPKQPLEADAYGEDGEMASPAEQKAATGVPSTIADALAVSHSRVQLRKQAGLDADPQAVTVEAAQAGGGADDTVVFLTRCDPGWTGATCSERVSSFRCNGGAGCGEHGNCTKWGCLCDRGWSGFDCSIPAAKLACPVGVPADAEGYYRHLAELDEAQKAETEALAARYHTIRKAAAAQAKKNLEAMDHERQETQGAILAGEEVEVAGSEEADAAAAEEAAEKDVEAAKADLEAAEEADALKDEVQAEATDEDGNEAAGDVAAAETEAESAAEGIEAELKEAEAAEAAEGGEAQEEQEEEEKEMEEEREEAGEETEEEEEAPSFLQRVARSFGLGSAVRRNRHRRPHHKHHSHRHSAARFRSIGDSASVLEGSEGVAQTGKAAEMAEMEAAMKAMESLKDVQAKMRERHTYMHGRGVGAPCSGRGICGSDGRCSCNEGYTGLACEKRVVMHGVCTPRERDQAEQERLEKLQVARQEQAAQLQAIALKRAELAAIKEERARKAVADGEAAGSVSEEEAEDAQLSAEMRSALEEQVRSHTAALNKPAMLPPPQLECICGTVPLDKAAFPGQMFRGPACDKRSCLNGCSGHGTCNGDGKCLCRGGWTGRDCSRAACPAACSYRGQCRLQVAVEHTVAGALIGSRRTRYTSAEEKQLAEELRDGAAHGDEVSGGDEHPQTLAGIVTGVAGLRRRAEKHGERRTLGDIANTLPPAEPGTEGAEKLNNTAAMAVGGNRPTQSEVNSAVEEIIENAVTPNEAAAYSEEGAAAASEGAETEVEAAASGEGGDGDVFDEAEAEGEGQGGEEEGAALLQRAATHSRRRARQDDAEAAEEAAAAPKDDVSDLASTLERAEAASKRAEEAAQAAQHAAEVAAQHADSSSGEATEEDAAAAEAAVSEQDGAEEADGVVAGGVNASLVANLTGAAEDGEEAVSPPAPVKTTQRVLGDVVRGEAPAADSPTVAKPLTASQRRKMRLEQALEHGADPFALGFPVTARCECDEGWGGIGCERRICPNGCSEHGICDKEAQVCKCFEGWVGPSCGVREDGGCEGGCGGPKRGKCIEGKCFCRATYTGPKCGRSVCKDDCNGKGICNAKDGTCDCLPGWAGELCSKKVCKNMCSEHGDCDKEEATCHCHAGWGGDDCSVKLYEQKKVEKEPEPSPEPSPAAKPANKTGEFVSLERPAHSVFGGTDILMVVG